MIKDQYDVIIIGAGPAGIFAALELTKKRKLSVLILEKGPSIERRRCAMQDNRGPCRRCSPCAILTGWGGAGAFSDGKLTLTPDFGGFLSEYMDKPSLEELIRYVDGVYLSFGASETLFGTDQEEIGRLQRLAAAANLSLVPARIRHLGTENCYQVLVKMCRALEGKAEIATGTSVEEIVASSGRVAGVKLSDGREIRSRCVICGPGRAGAEWFQRESVRLGLPGANNPVDIGVRVEVPAVLMEHLTRVVYEPKLVYYSRSFDDRIRTFCMNPYGIVVTEHNNGLVTVNGHSYAGKGSENTNFALLVSKTFTEPFNEPICYGKNIAGLANMLGGGVIVQRLGDLQRGRRSTAERIARGLTRPTLAEATPEIQPGSPLPPPGGDYGDAGGPG